VLSRIVYKKQRGRRWLTALAAMSLATSTLVVASSALASPSNYVNITNHQPKYTAGTFDWANSGTLTSPTTPDGVWTVSGTNGLFDGGIFHGTTTTPTAPLYIGPTGLSSVIVAHAFLTDALSVDTARSPADTCGTGDPTTYTGVGGETNGEALGTETYSTSSVPNKDDLSNVYAIHHRDDVSTPTTNEIFFGGERVVNNGDSHIDYEFLQQQVNLTGTCAGGFTGHRTPGDLILAVDFTNGGALGSKTIYQWKCNGTPVAADGSCDPTKGKNSPSYVKATDATILAAVDIAANDAGAVGCGGWVCRNADGTTTTTIATNEFFEGGIDLKALGFTGCLATFLPHTRSSQSFTATLKDFAGPINFDSCNPATTLVTQSASTTIHAGDTVTIVVRETNTGNRTLTSVNVTGTNSCLTYTASATKVGGSTFSGTLLPGEAVDFTCTFTAGTTGFTWTATGHGIDPNGNAAPSTNETQSGTVTVINPSTSLRKTAQVTIVYTFLEDNTGNDPLTGVSVTDDHCTGTNAPAYVSGDTNSDGILDTTETWKYQCTVLTTDGANLNVTNTGTGHGTDSLNTAVPSTDESDSVTITVTHNAPN
jgi:hypothetical protein